MKILSPAIFAAALSASVSLSGSASTNGKNTAIELARAGFNTIDTTDRGFVDWGQFYGHAENIFVSMDSDDNGLLEQSEFLFWDYGMNAVAEELDRVAAYDAALRVVFAFWDRDGDGTISKREHRKALQADFDRADLNENAVLSENEFLSGFTVMLAIRAALSSNQ